jgi:hypothetical protein
MTVLAYPRIHFKGRCLLNPATGNNDDVTVNLDTVNVRLFPSLATMSDAEARAWLMEGVQAISVINNQPHTYLRCGWNYFGDMSVEFAGATVVSVVGADGRWNCCDPVVGGPVRLLGGEPGGKAVFCDLDPVGTIFAQIFTGGLQVGDASVGLLGRHDARAHSYWVIFRNASTYPGEQNFVGAGATWQFAIPRDCVKLACPSGGSVLDDFVQAFETNPGLVVQFCVYLPEPHISDDDLIALFRRGCFVSNPAEAYVVGTIGLWEPGDLETVPGGRLLLPPPDAENPLLSPSNPIALGPAAARVHAHRPTVSLNLITAFPEANYDRPPTQKVDIGPVRLGVIPPWGGPPIPLGNPLDYGNARYEATAGILDVDYDPAVVAPGMLHFGTLVVLADRFPAGPILTEAYSTVTVETDHRAVYRDVGESGEIGILVRERGRAPAADQLVFLWEYQNVTYPGGAQHRAYTEVTPVGQGGTLEHRICLTPRVFVPAGGTDPVLVPFVALRPGSLVLGLTLDGEPPQGDYPWGTGFYAGVRVMPHDDYSSVPQAHRLSWDFIYQNIIRYYYLIYPAMSLIFPLNDEAAMRAAAGRVMERSHPDQWLSARYMPISRDLSTGKRQLLIEWVKSIAP